MNSYNPWVTLMYKGENGKMKKYDVTLETVQGCFQIKESSIRLVSSGGKTFAAPEAWATILTGGETYYVYVEEAYPYQQPSLPDVQEGYHQQPRLLETPPTQRTWEREATLARQNAFSSGMPNRGMGQYSTMASPVAQGDLYNQVSNQKLFSSSGNIKRSMSTQSTSKKSKAKSAPSVPLILDFQLGGSVINGKIKNVVATVQVPLDRETLMKQLHEVVAHFLLENRPEHTRYSTGALVSSVGSPIPPLVMNYKVGDLCGKNKQYKSLNLILPEECSESEEEKRESNQSAANNNFSAIINDTNTETVSVGTLQQEIGTVLSQLHMLQKKLSAVAQNASIVRIKGRDVEASLAELGLMCIICMSEAKSAMACPACDSTMCAVCIESWLKSERGDDGELHNGCPTCRAPVSFDLMDNGPCDLCRDCECSSRLKRTKRVNHILDLLDSKKSLTAAGNNGAEDNMGDGDDESV